MRSVSRPVRKTAAKRSRRIRSYNQESSAGRRETKKADKRERIKLAARALFSRYGYEATTIRQIAKRAGVALGTVSLYATDKRDLIMLTFNDNVRELIDIATAGIRDDVDCLENFIAYFRGFYIDFGRNLNLGRTFLMLNFFAEGINSDGLKANTGRMLRGIQKIVDLAKSQGRLDNDIDSELIAESVRLTFAGALRYWIAQDSPSVNSGLAHLRQLLKLQAKGYAAGSGAERRRISAGAELSKPQSRASRLTRVVGGGRARSKSL